MSYHVLQQFDEQLLSEIVRHDSKTRTGAPPAWTNRRHKPHPFNSSDRRNGLWLIVLTSLLIAAFALTAALDAHHTADALQQRHTALEKPKR